MRKKSFIVFSFLVCLFFLPTLLPAQSLKIGVMSDLHYMAPSLIVQKGSAFNYYTQHDRKLLAESPAILKAAVQNLLNENVDIVLVSGDLTKDGELVSHEGVVEMLKPLLDKGVKVLVVPGNHDINNPHALSFNGAYTKAVATVSAEEFRKIYGKYGFASAISSDVNSLSYVSEPVDGLRVLCIDDCKYYENTFKARGDKFDASISSGAIKPETMQWILQEIKDAKDHGKQIIGMIHHNVVEHFDYEALFAAPYVVDDYGNVQKKLMSAGLKVVFTGHFHATDIARVDDENGNSLYDVETGSLVSYPSAYRLIELAGDSLSIKTKHIEHIDLELPGGVDFQTYARNMLAKEVPEILSGFIGMGYQRISKSVPKVAAPFVKIPSEEDLSQMALKYFSKSSTDLLLAHYSGNENLADGSEIKRKELIENIDAFIHDFAVKSSGMFSPMVEEAMRNTDITSKLKDAFNSIWEDRIEPEYRVGDYKWQTHEPVNDLNLVIKLANK